MPIDLVRHIVPFAWIGLLSLVFAGAAIQVAVGVGLSVVCGAPLFLWFGPAVGVPTLLCLNLLVSVLATAFGVTSVRWGAVALASVGILAGCAVAWCLASFSAAMLKGITACVLLVVALPRPPAPDALPSTLSVRVGVTLASLATGALTVWTATPGPILPVALVRAGRSGADIRRTMQPISTVGYGFALAWAGLPPSGAFGTGFFAWLVGAVTLGVGLGFLLRHAIATARVVLLVRVVAAVAASLLLVFLLH